MMPGGATALTLLSVASWSLKGWLLEGQAQGWASEVPTQ